jgi:hypothetical protein
MNVVAFEPKHLHNLIAVLGISNLSEDCMKLFSTPGHAFTALNQEEVLGCAGVMPLWRGCGEAVSFLTPKFRGSFPIGLHKSVSRGLRNIQQTFHYHRIQVNVELGNHIGYMWAERLGFQWEGVMPFWTPDKRTFVRFGQIWI